MGKDTEQIRREIEDTRERIGETADAIGYKADVPARVRENINDKVEGVKQSVRSGIDTITSTVSGTSSKVGDAVGGTAGDMKKSMKGATARVIQNPLGLAIGAAAIGFLAGLAIPITEIEEQNLGPIRDQIADQIKDADLLEHGKQVLQETAQAAMSSAQDHAEQVTQTISGGNEEDSEFESSDSSGSSNYSPKGA